MTKDEIIHYLKTENEDEIKKLFDRADEARKKYVGDEIHLRGLIEFSNYCSKNCLYCGIRKDNTNVYRYTLTADEIFNSASQAADLGYKTVVLQSGECMVHSVKELCKIIEKIKKQRDLAITLSLGELSFDDYSSLKNAGADRYLMRFETSDENLFSKLKPDSDYSLRFKILDRLKKLNFQVGSGIMIGLPGQTEETLANDILLFKKLELDMIGNGPYIYDPKTPMTESKGGTLISALKFTALTRIVTLDTHIPATTALGTINPTGRQQALKCGANVMMPNVTPRQYRKHYQLYPNKICVNEQPSDCKNCIGAMVKMLGRKVGQGFGHSFKDKV